MKLITKIALLTFAISSSLSHAESAKYQNCVKVAGGKNCYSLQVNIPKYPQEWMTDIAIGFTFEGFDYQAETLAGIAKEMVDDLLSSAVDPDNVNEKINWQPLEEGNGYVQLIREENYSSTREQETTNKKSYFIFHKNEPTALLSLENIVNKNVKQKLINLLKSYYIEWQIQNIGNGKQDATDIANRYLRELPSSFSFAKNAITFSFYQTEIGPASYDQVDLIIPVKNLAGIIKPDALKAAQQWKTHAF